MIGLLLSAASLYFVFQNTDIAGMGRTIVSADPFLMTLAIPPVVFQLAVRGLRWRYLLPDKRHISGKRLFEITAIGYALSNFLPGRVGDLYRGFAVAAEENIRRTVGLTSVFIEKLLDSVILILLLAALSLAFVLPGSVSEGIRAFSLTIAVVMGVTVAFVLLPLGLRKRFFSILPLPHQISEAIESSLENFDRTVKHVAGRESLIRQVPLSGALWVLAAAYYYLVLQAFDLGVSVSGVLLLTCITSIGMAIPSAPGNLGVFHYLTVLTLAFYGIPKEEALGVAVVLHGVNYMVITLIGIVVFYERNMKLNDLEVE